MEKSKICEVLKKTKIVMCIEENCKNKFLCFDCFKTHDNCFKTNDNNDYKDLLSSNEKITQIETDNKKTNISFYIDLELKRKDTFKIKLHEMQI